MSTRGTYVVEAWSPYEIGGHWYVTITRHDACNVTRQWYPFDGWELLRFKTPGRAFRFAQRLIKATRNPHSKEAAVRRLYGAMGRWV